MLGLILALTASLLVGTTTAIQKYSLRKMKKFVPGRILKNRTWQLSIPVGVAGMVTYVISLSYESILVVQPIVSASFIIPVIAGQYIFGEKIGTKWFHIALMLLGVVLLSA